MEIIKPHTLSRLHGAAARAADPARGHDGCPAQNLRALRLSHRSTRPPSRRPTCCSPRAAARPKKADLPLPEGRRRPGAALRSHGAAGQIRRHALRRAGLPVPPLPDRQGSIAASARSAAASASSTRADIDVIGDGKLDIVNEAEIPSIICRTFTALGLRRFQIRVNNRKILNGFYAMQGLSDKSGDIMRTVDKLDKIGPDKVREILTDDCGLAQEAAQAVLDFIAIRGTNEEVLASLGRYAGKKTSSSTRGLSELRAVTKYLAAFGVPEENFAVDLTICARTRLLHGHRLRDDAARPTRRSAPSAPAGGTTISRSTTPSGSCPGVGISIGLTRLFYVLGEQGMLNPARPTAPADVLVLPMTDELGPAGRDRHLPARLRAARAALHRAEEVSRPRSSTPTSWASPYILILGEDELAAGKVSVKELATGEQQTLTREEAAGADRPRRFRTRERQHHSGEINLLRQKEGHHHVSVPYPHLRRAAPGERGRARHACRLARETSASSATTLPSPSCATFTARRSSSWRPRR
jgi:histidyl-tRNA synthetase